MSLLLKLVGGGGGGTISGSFGKTLGSFTQSAAGKLIIKGTASATLGSFTQAAAGKVLIKGTLTQTLDAFTQSATGKVLIKSAAAQTLGAFTQVSTGRVLIQGQFGQTLGAFTQSASGDAGTLPTISGSAAQTLGAFTQSASATMSQPTPVVTPSQSTGGGPFGGMAWYDRKYRKQIRNTIETVLHELNSTKDRRKKKRVIRKAKAQIAEVVSFDVPHVPLVFAPLEETRLQLLSVAVQLVPIEKQLVKLMDDYRTRLRSIERNEEEAILAILLLAA